MNKQLILQNVLPVLAAMIWGVAFVAQSVCADYLFPFSINMLRSLIAAVFIFAMLVVVWLWRRGRAIRQGQPHDAAAIGDVLACHSREQRRSLLLGGLLCGTALTVSANLQQFGINADTSSGKAGFITALYIVLVPLLGLFLKKKVGLSVWGSVILAVFGLYFLCVSEAFTVQTGDVYVMICAFTFAIQILLIDHFTAKVNGLALSLMQFVVVTLESALFVLFFREPLSVPAIVACLPSLLYVGVFSSGVAYTLQIISQKGSNPTVVSILFSLEAVFATVSGMLLLHESMSSREWIGCALMLAAVMLAQIPTKNRRLKSETNS